MLNLENQLPRFWIYCSCYIKVANTATIYKVIIMLLNLFTFFKNLPSFKNLEHRDIDSIEQNVRAPRCQCFFSCSALSPGGVVNPVFAWPSLVPPLLIRGP